MCVSVCGCAWCASVCECRYTWSCAFEHECVYEHWHMSVSVCMSGGETVRRHAVPPCHPPALRLHSGCPDLSSTGDACPAFLRTALIPMIYPLAPLVPFIFPTHTALCSGWKMQPPSPGASVLSRAWGGAYVLSTWLARVGLGTREDERPFWVSRLGLCVWGQASLFPAQAWPEFP